MSETHATHSVTVEGLSSTTTQATLEHFFSFCGKIQGIQHEGNTAKISFVKESAAKTALMLNGGTLDSSTITVTSEDTAAPSLANVKSVTSSAQTPAEKDESEISQEDKPRTAIAAEYLAAGYHLGDTAIERAIAADKEYGISARFLSFFQPLATKVQAVAQPHVDRASEKLHEVDEKQGLSLKAHAASVIGGKYYTAALNSPFGQKVLAFYTSTSKQAKDVHEEAVRIKESKKTSGSGVESGTGSTQQVPTESSAPGVSSQQAPIVSSGTVEGSASGKEAEKPLSATLA